MPIKNIDPHSDRKNPGSPIAKLMQALHLSWKNGGAAELDARLPHVRSGRFDAEESAGVNPSFGFQRQSQCEVTVIIPDDVEELDRAILATLVKKLLGRGFFVEKKQERQEKVRKETVEGVEELIKRKYFYYPYAPGELSSEKFTDTKKMKIIGSEEAIDGIFGQWRIFTDLRTGRSGDIVNITLHQLARSIAHSGTESTLDTSTYEALRRTAGRDRDANEPLAGKE